jgi:hypothetical protein
MPDIAAPKTIPESPFSTNPPPSNLKKEIFFLLPFTHIKGKDKPSQTSLIQHIKPPTPSEHATKTGKKPKKICFITYDECLATWRGIGNLRLETSKVDLSDPLGAPLEAAFTT